MSTSSIADSYVRGNEELPQAVSEHTTPPADLPGLVAWLRLRAQHHSLLAEQRPWAAAYHERLATSALECADYYETRGVRK